MHHHDLHLLRSEIKSWERDFASTHGRDPSVQDIRGQPSIAEKYKLYKKLSKTTHSRLPAPKSRPIESVDPLPGYNPFSPVKKHAQRTPRHPNPFTTPSKKKPSTTTPSPDQLPVVHPASSSLENTVSTAAVSRARKRLRGEPVSPSPNKPKRQRVRAQVLPSIPTSDRDSSNSQHESDHELPLCDTASSFVADSPVKAPTGGKSFKRLFDDVLPALPLPNKPIGPSLAQQRPSADHPVPVVLKPRLDRMSKRVTPRSGHQMNRIQGKLSAQIFPAKDHPPAPSHKSTLTSTVSQVLQPTTSTKRPLEGSDLASLQQQYPLVPPSPPPHDTTNRDTGKAKVKTTAGRKKQRVEPEESDEEVDSPDSTTFKLATIRLDRSKHRRADDIEWDPLLHVGTHNHETAPIDDADHHASGTLTIDLPDRFRRVLAISPLRCQNSTEERVVRGLLYGDRVGHYDPSRGGVIWDAGETDEGVLGDAETEDDWEGEPVPWEAGEL